MAIATIESAEHRRFPRWALWLIVIAVLLLGGYVVWRMALKAGIRNELAAIRAAGYPATPAELNAWYPDLPAGTPNAAAELDSILPLLKRPEDVFGNDEINAEPWAKAGLLWGASGTPGTGPVMKRKASLIPYQGGDCEKPADDQPYPTQCMELTHSYLQANQAAMQRIAAAVKIPDSRFPADYSRGPATTLPTLGELRMTCNLFALQAIDAETTHDAEQATEAICNGLNLAQSMKREPLLVTQLVRVACIAVTGNALQRAGYHVRFNADQLTRLDKALADCEQPDAFMRAMVGECALFHVVFDDPNATAVTGYGMNSFEAAFYQITGINDYCHMRYLQAMQEYRQITALPDEQQDVEAAKLDAQNEAMTYGWIKPMALVPQYMGRVLLIRSRNLALVRTARTALAAERYRLDHNRGRWPTSWAELTPTYLDAPLLDPFTGKPLLMKIDGPTLTIYSVGDDRTDDGGTLKNAKGEPFQPGTDIPFVIRRP